MTSSPKSNTESLSSVASGSILFRDLLAFEQNLFSIGKAAVPRVAFTRFFTFRFSTNLVELSKDSAPARKSEIHSHDWLEVPAGRPSLSLSFFARVGRLVSETQKKKTCTCSSTSATTRWDFSGSWRSPGHILKQSDKKWNSATQDGPTQ